MASIPTTQKYISTEQEVNDLLTNLHFILKSGSYELDILPKKKSEAPNDPHTTQNTLLALDYDTADVADRLLELQVQDYSETIIDDKDASLPPFFVFYLCISGRDVYIKVKIRNLNDRKIFCVSFHFARQTAGPFPYRI